MAKKRKAKAWRDPHDWYCEDAAPVHSLFDHYRFSGRVYDPCCGRGNIPDVARGWGCNVVATDLIDRPSMPPGAKLAELGKKAFKGGRIVYVWMHWDRTKLPKPPIWLPAWEGQP